MAGKAVAKIRDGVCVVGLGNWGTSLAAALRSAGVPLREVVVRRRSPKHWPDSPAPVLWSEAALDGRILWLCVPDAAIAETAARIAQRRASLAGQMVVHSSGALTVDALAAARRAGAAVASAHPAMTFPTRDAVSLGGVLFGIEAEATQTRRRLRSLVRRIGGVPFDLRSQDKAIYHAAGTLASPLLVSALTAAMETARLAGLDEKTASRWVQEMAERTAGNFFARGPQKSFSGPFARGDAGTIALHLRALAPHPLLTAVYRSLAEYAVERLPVRNTRELAAVLGGSAVAKSLR